MLRGYLLFLRISKTYATRSGVLISQSSVPLRSSRERIRSPSRNKGHIFIALIWDIV